FHVTGVQTCALPIFGLTLFVVVHMLGNLLAFSPDESAYNAYSHKLISLGVLLYAIEIGLLVFVVVHIILGVSIYLRKRAARPIEIGRASCRERVEVA